MLLRCAWIFSAPLRLPDLPLRMAQDDFYYYLKVAQNLAWHHQSSFFPGVLTNGYHPLYFAVLTAMSVFVHTLPGVFRFLWLLDMLSAAAVFFLSRRLLLRVAPALLANGLAVLITAVSVTQICNQMEVTLAIPFGMAFLLLGFVPGRDITAGRAALLGLLAALTFLSRLDAVLLVLVWVVAALCTRTYRAAFTTRNMGAFLATSLPLPLLYLWINHHFFHALLPISGMAKQLRHGHRPSVLLPGSFNGTSELLVLVALLAGVFALVLRRQLQARERVLLFTTVCTPFVFYGMEMVVSDWPVWNWYFYALRFSAVGASVLIAVVLTRDVIPPRYEGFKRLAAGPVFAGVLCVGALLKLFVANYNVDHWMVEIQHATGVLNQFAATHPGVYAVGDRAGMFSITTTNPVLQTEGLVMDRRFLEHLRAQDDLRSVLRSYGVNYYVVFAFKDNEGFQTQGNCFHALEPSIAGPDALRMQSTFCEQPLLQFPGFDGQYRIYRINPS